MDEASIIQYISDTFEGTETVTSTGNTFFFYDPKKMMPFVTLVTNDEYDSVSALNRPGVFRLNIGISKVTFVSLFGERPLLPGVGNDTGSDFDFAALDRLMPHPIYGRMYWVSVLNPSVATFETVVRPLLAEAYELAVAKQARRVVER